MNALDNQDWGRPSQGLFDGWNAFLSEWRGFYKGTFGGLFNFSAWNDSNRDQLIQFEQRFGEFANEYQAATQTTLPGGVVSPSTGTQDNLGSHVLNQLQPLIPSMNIRTVLLVVGAVGVTVFVFRRQIMKAIGG